MGKKSRQAATRPPKPKTNPAPTPEQLEEARRRHEAQKRASAVQEALMYLELAEKAVRVYDDLIYAATAEDQDVLNKAAQVADGRLAACRRNVLAAIDAVFEHDGVPGEPETPEAPDAQLVLPGV